MIGTFEMSTKNNSLIAAAATALGMTFVSGTSPVCEGMLNDLNVTAFGASEVDTSGKVLVLVEITTGTGGGATTAVRAVADSLGNVRLFADGNAAVALAKRSNLASGVQVKFVKADKVASIGDPVTALKAKYKRFKNEAAASLKQQTIVDGKRLAALALEWDTSTGTPEYVEYTDIVARLASVNEWKSYNDAQVIALAASLTAAGIDPLTVV